MPPWPGLACWQHFFLRVLQGPGGHSEGSFVLGRISTPSRQRRDAGWFPYPHPKTSGISLLPCEPLLTLQILVTCILTVWSLPLSIRTIIGPWIKKQGTWLGATPTRGNEKEGKIWRDLSHKLWMGHLLCKATPRTHRPKSRYQQQDVRGPCTETGVPSPLPRLDKQTQVRRGGSMKNQQMEKGANYPISEVMGQQHFLSVF